MLDKLPDAATREDVEYSIYVRERDERGRREAAESNFIRQEEIEHRLERWLTK